MNDPGGRRIRINSPGLSPEDHDRYAGSALVGGSLITNAFADAHARGGRATPVSFHELVLRIRALTGLSPRRASLVAGEFECATRVIDPRQPSATELIVKAKDLGYLPLEWRLPG